MRKRRQKVSGVIRSYQELSGVIRSYQEKSGEVRRSQELPVKSNQADREGGGEGEEKRDEVKDL